MVVIKIDIGGGTIPAQHHINLDPTHGKGIWQRYAQDTPWPTADNSVDAIRASHVMEHIPSGSQRIDVMNEAHRVLKPGRIFEIIVPCVMIHDEIVQSWAAWADPTHVSYWCYPQSWLYFCEGNIWRANADYGIKYWAPLDESLCERKNIYEMVVRLRKP